MHAPARPAKRRNMLGAGTLITVPALAQKMQQVTGATPGSRQRNALRRRPAPPG